MRIYKSPDAPIDRYENSWHTDATWREKPPFGCVLRCVECPPLGGDTLWVNMAAAYANLAEDVKQTIDGLRAVHDVMPFLGRRMPPEQRAVVMLVCVEGQSYKEAADTLAIPIGTVMSRLSRARGVLARQLGEDAASPSSLHPNQRPGSACAMHLGVTLRLFRLYLCHF